MTRFIFFLCFSSAFISCTKWHGDNTTVRGKVINDITKQPMQNFEIDVVENKTTSFANRTSQTIATMHTNSNGEFETKFHARIWNKYSYELMVAFDNQMYDISYTDHYLTNTEIKKTEDNFFNVPIAPAGSLTVALSPPPPYGVNDSIRADFNHKNWILPNMIVVTNKTVNSSGIAVPGVQMMGQYTVNITKLKSGVPSSQTDTFYLNWNEAKTYTINF